MNRQRLNGRSRGSRSLSARALRAGLAAPLAVRLAVGMMLTVLLWAGANWAYQAARKPTELLFPVSMVLVKTPAQTWREYGPQFRQHATAVVTPQFLAALAQIESAANPLAQTYWRWSTTWHPFEVYRPASSAMGMYQITDGTFAQARPECRGKQVPGRNAPTDSDPCWFESLYSRVLPEESIALTAQRLDHAVVTALRRTGIARATLRQKQALAAVIHLCGPGGGAAYARRGFRPKPGQRCGDHQLQGYLDRMYAATRQFARLALADG